MVCPGADTLFAMVDPGGDPALFGELEAHIDGCEHCRKSVAALAAGSKAPFGDTRSIDVNTVLPGERYVVASVLGRGGMGTIVSAYDRHLHRKVALKELREQRPDLEARFRREALLTARLEHPNIVSMHEAGTWPSGEPFYTMRLVSGRPLDKVIADAKTVQHRLALLPHAIAVADALAFAHKERIIHRDLKPANVMVGEFGETVVIDWGLAKDLAVEGDEIEVAAVEAPEGATRAGEIMGTPAYMPPEQAEGDPVDPRADVYAIGAILYHLLAGVPPYVGASSVEVIDAVCSGPPVPLGERQPGLPRDLLAIIARAMARDADARYPTARELAEDLRRFQTGQLVAAHRYTPVQLVRRWLARHRTAVSVAGAALVFLAIVAVVSIQRIISEQHRVEEERLLAEQHRGEAEDLLQFMLVDLKDKLQPIGKLDLLDAVAKKATVFYEHQPSGRTDEENRQRAVVHRNLGDVMKARGDLKGALVEYRTALSLREQLVARGPASPDVQRDLASTYSNIGDVLRAQGDSAGALAQYRISLAARQKLAAQTPSNAELQRDVSISYDKIGNMLQIQGDATGALAQYRGALAIRQQLAAHDPSPEAQRDVSVSQSKIGEVLLTQGDSAAALVAFQTALAIRDQLSTKDPTNAEWLRDLSVSQDNIGDVLRERDAAAALVQYRAALQTADKLAAHDPTNATWQRDLAVAHAKIGEMLRAQDDVRTALVEFRTGLAIVTQLAVKDPTNAETQRDFIILRERVGDALLALHDTAGALAEFRAVLPLKEKLAADDRNNADLQHDVSVSHSAIGDILRARGELTAALAEYRAELPIAERVAAHDPHNAGWQRDLAVSHRNIADTLRALNQPATALAEYRAALAIAEQPGAQDATNEQWKQELEALRHTVETLGRGAR